MTDTITPDAPAPATSADEITAKLNSLGITDETQIKSIKSLGAETVDDLSGLTESDLVNAGIPVLKARKMLSSLRPQVAKEATISDMSVNFDTVLPSVPDDTSWLNALRTGGVSKVEQSTVIAAIRAALADRYNFYDIPKLLLTEMERYIDATEEQVSEEFWKIRKQLTKRSYGDLFAVIDGLDGTFISEKRKTELISRIHETLWPAIVSFQSHLSAWQESWMQGAANPVMMMAALVGGSVGLPPGMMQPPDCGVLRDAAAAVNDSLNRTFRGTGVQITAALAYEANEIKKMIENPRLPILCGVPSRDLLLKKLNIGVPATYPRMEQNLSRYVLGIMQSDKVAAGVEETKYFSTLFVLGNQIPWSDLTNSATPATRTRPRGIGGATDPADLFKKTSPSKTY